MARELQTGPRQTERAPVLVPCRRCVIMQAVLMRSPEQIRGSFMHRLGLPPSPKLSATPTSRCGIHVESTPHSTFVIRSHLLLTINGVEHRSQISQSMSLIASAGGSARRPFGTRLALPVWASSCVVLRTNFSPCSSCDLYRSPTRRTAAHRTSAKEGEISVHLLGSTGRRLPLQDIGCPLADIAHPRGGKAIAASATVINQTVLVTRSSAETQRTMREDVMVIGSANKAKI